MNFVSRTIPYHLSEDVPTNPKIEIYFFLDLDKGTLNQDKIILFNLTEERTEKIKYEYQNKRLTITPVKDLGPNMHYQIQLVGGRKGLKNIIGQEMAETYVSEFYTKTIREVQPPVVTFPTDLTETISDITFKWKPAINAKFYELEISKTNTFHHLVWPLEQTPVYETTVTPHINYDKGTYYARIRSIAHDGTKSHYSRTIRYYFNGVKQADNMNDQHQEESIILETAGKVLESTSIIESLQKHFMNEKAIKVNESFSITGSSPKHKGLNIRTGTGFVTITFDQDVDPDSVTADSIYIVEERN